MRKDQPKEIGMIINTYNSLDPDCREIIDTWYKKKLKRTKEVLKSKFKNPELEEDDLLCINVDILRPKKLTKVNMSDERKLEITTEIKKRLSSLLEKKSFVEICGGSYTMFQFSLNMNWESKTISIEDGKETTVGGFLKNDEFNSVEYFQLSTKIFTEEFENYSKTI